MVCEIPLTRGLVALVDDDDFDLVSQYKWYAHPRGRIIYARSGFRVKPSGEMKHIRMHRLITGVPIAMDVDHISGDGLDNRKSNLRIATRSQNLGNQPKRITNTSGFKGINFYRRLGKWQAELVSQGVRYRSKFLPTAEEAARAYDELSRIHHGEFCCVNFPREDERAAI